MGRRTRRAFLGRAGALGLAAAGLAALGPSIGSLPASADERGTAITVLAGQVVHRRGLAALTGDAAGASRESPVVRTDFPFTHLGLHWRGREAQQPELRTSLDGLLWSDWTRPSLERRPEETPVGEWFTTLVGARRAQFAQYRLASADPAPEQVTLTYLNALDGPRRSLGAEPRPGRLALGPAVAYADGADFRTGIVTREQWGADESLRFAGDGSEWTRVYVAPRAVVVHHTETDNDPLDPAADVRAIYHYHAITEGFGDIGYNALIDRQGRIYEGRRGRDADPFGRLERDVLSFGVVAGHVLDYNYGSVGIALLGSYQDEAPPEPMLRRLEDLLIFEHRRHQIDPRGSVDFARQSRLWRYDLPTLPGHRDCNNTTCPGDQVYRLLPDLRRRVAERIEGSSGPPRAIVEAPELRNAWLGPATYQWTGVPPYDCIFEGFRKPIGVYDIEYGIGYDERAMPEHIVTGQTRVTFNLRSPGQYTLHLSPGDRVFADRRTVLADRHVVRDNADVEGVERVGTWMPSVSVKLFYGSDYEFAACRSDARFTWRLEVPESGRYTVQTCWTEGGDRAPDAPYTIARGATPLATVRADQTQNGGVWVDLGTFDFAAAETCTVTLSSDASGQVVIADAARIVMAD